VLGAWPEAIAEGSVGDGQEIINPRAAPYRFTVVMIEPPVVVMRFDLGARQRQLRRSRPDDRDAAAEPIGPLRHPTAGRGDVALVRARGGSGADTRHARHARTW